MSEAKKIIYKCGKEAKHGDIIRWNAYDYDDFHTWHFTGMVHSDCVVYLGGGLDFGSAIGNKFTFEKVISESEENDDYNKGIEYIGSAKDLYKVIANWKG